MSGDNTSSAAGTTALGGGDAGAGTGAAGGEGAETGANVSTATGQGAGGAGSQGTGAQGGQGAQGADGAGDKGNGGEAGKGGQPTELEITLPEGFSADEKTLGAFKAKAKELGLDSPKAQGLIEFYASTMKAAAEAQQAQSESVYKGWLEAQRADKEYGGADLEKSIGYARKAVQKFATPELREFLNTTGLGDHPELLRTFIRIGKAMKEDSVAAAGGDAGAGDPEMARLKQMYPSMFKSA